MIYEPVIIIRRRRKRRGKIIRKRSEEKCEGSGAPKSRFGGRNSAINFPVVPVFPLVHLVGVHLPGINTH